MEMKISCLSSPHGETDKDVKAEYEDSERSKALEAILQPTLPFGLKILFYAFGRRAVALSVLSLSYFFPIWNGLVVL